MISRWYYYHSCVLWNFCFLSQIQNFSCVTFHILTSLGILISMTREIHLIFGLNLRQKRFSINQQLPRISFRRVGDTIRALPRGDPLAPENFRNLAKMHFGQFFTNFKKHALLFRAFDEKSKNPRLLSQINYLFKFSFLLSYHFRFINVSFLSELFLTAANFSAIRKS